MDFGGALSAFTQIPIDWLIIGVFFIIVAADAVRVGSVRAAAIALSFPITSLLFAMIPQTIALGSLVGRFSTTVEQAVIFAVLEAIVFVCLNQMLFSYDRYTSLLSATAAALAATIVVLVMWTQTPFLQSIWHFDPQIQAIFGASYRFLWLIGSYLVLAFVGS